MLCIWAGYLTLSSCGTHEQGGKGIRRQGKKGIQPQGKKAYNPKGQKVYDHDRTRTCNLSLRRATRYLLRYAANAYWSFCASRIDLMRLEDRRRTSTEPDQHGRQGWVSRHGDRDGRYKPSDGRYRPNDGHICITFRVQLKYSGRISPYYRCGRIRLCRGMCLGSPSSAWRW